MAIMRNIILTGFMGTGKSSVGKLLAKHLGYTFVDTDAVIEARTGMAVHAIFEQRGEAAFRAMEAALARELADGRRQVIATGGRLMLDGDNAAVLSRNGIVFCLWAEPEDIFSRVIAEGAAARPLLAGPAPQERIEALLAERREGYRQFAPISTSGRTIAEVVQALLDRLPSVDGVDTAFRE
jgi:shikimate kinase